MSENEEAATISSVKNFEPSLTKKITCLLDQFSDDFLPEVKFYRYKYQEVQITLERGSSYETRYRIQVARGLLGTLFGTTERVPYRELKHHYYARVRTYENDVWRARLRHRLCEYHDSVLDDLKDYVEEVIPDFESQGWIVINYRKIDKGFTYYLKKEIECESII